jgi:hypothetical protein
LIRKTVLGAQVSGIEFGELAVEACNHQFPSSVFGLVCGKSSHLQDGCEGLKAEVGHTSFKSVEQQRFGIAFGMPKENC